MILKVNGKTGKFKNNIKTVADLLSLLKIKNTEKIAVEVNREIIIPSRFRQTPVQDKDNIEIVSFVGGG